MSWYVCLYFKDWHPLTPPPPFATSCSREPPAESYKPNFLCYKRGVLNVNSVLTFFIFKNTCFIFKIHIYFKDLICSEN